jgi:signal transduction histidine kinase
MRWKVIRPGLMRRLLFTHIALSIIVGGLLTLLALWSIDTLESHLQRIDMGLAITRIRGEYLAGKDPGRPNRFFHGPIGSTSFPEWLRPLAPGFHKVQQGELRWHAIVEDYRGTRYILLRDYTDYENDRQIPHWVLGLGLATSLLLAVAFGMSTAFGIVGPIHRLAQRVEALSAEDGATAPPPPDSEDEIRQLELAFDRTFSQLQHALQRERLFTADVSHELRTPLMVISSTSELLLQQHDCSDAQYTALKKMEYAALDIRQRLDAYLMLARGEDMSQVFPRVTLAKAAQEQVDSWGGLAQRRSVNLSLRLLVEAQAQTYPQPLLYGVLSNLIRNAIQHSGPGVNVLVEVKNDTLRVQDDGPGIDETSQADIFSPFVSAAPMPPQHLGLGLSVVKRICDSQGWRVALQSKAGCGCVFYVDFAANTRSQQQRSSNLNEYPRSCS